MSARGWFMVTLLLPLAAFMLLALLLPAHIATPQDKASTKRLLRAYTHCRNQGYVREICMGTE